jgi:putative ABC transport system substrate-binding protein
MQRREFMALLGGAATWPLAAHAQNPVVPKIGFLHVASAKPFPHIVAGFRQGLKETGFIEAENVAIEFRWAEGQTGSPTRTGRRFGPSSSCSHCRWGR